MTARRESYRVFVMRIPVVAAVLLLALSCHAQQTDTAGLPVVKATVTISDAVSTALSSNPMITARRAMESAASARVGMARAMTRPRLSTSTFATTGTMSMILAGPEGVDPQNITQVPGTGRLGQNFMAMFPLYTGGKLSGKVGGAEALRSSAAADYTAAELDVALETKTAFHRSLLQCKFIEAYQRRVDEARERVRIAEVAFSEGRIAKYDLLRNQTELAEAERMLVDAQKELQMALIDLKSAMGISQSSELTLSGELQVWPVSETPEQLQATALKQRPELKAARARMLFANASLRVAKSADKPQVYATAMQDFAAIRHNGSENGYIVGVTAAIPIFDGGERSAAKAEARAMQAQSLAEERDTVLRVTRDVASALAELQAAGKNVELSEAAVDQADEDYRVIKMRYEAGKAINVEVLDALASLTRAQTGYAESLYQHNIAREKLLRAIGQK